MVVRKGLRLGTWDQLEGFTVFKVEDDGGNDSTLDRSLNSGAKTQKEHAEFEGPGARPGTDAQPGIKFRWKSWCRIDLWESST